MLDTPQKFSDGVEKFLTPTLCFYSLLANCVCVVYRWSTGFIIIVVYFIIIGFMIIVFFSVPSSFTTRRSPRLSLYECGSNHFGLTVGVQAAVACKTDFLQLLFCGLWPAVMSTTHHYVRQVPCGPGAFTGNPASSSFGLFVFVPF